MVAIQLDFGHNNVCYMLNTVPPVFNQKLSIYHIIDIVNYISLL